MMVEDFREGTTGFKPLHPDVRSVLVDGVRFIYGVIPGSEVVSQDLLQRLSV